METTFSRTLSETLECLLDLGRDNPRPEEAQERLRAVQQRHPEVPMQLLWEEVTYDGSVHYDALVRLDREGTFSLSFCPDGGTPWPMRGAHRWSERDLLSVDGTVLQVGPALACLDFIWDEERLIDRLVDVCLIRRVLRSDPVELSDDELQRAMDNFRRAHAIHRAEDTRRWLRERGMTHQQLECLVSEKATIAKLRRRVTARSVEEYFESHRAEFDRAHVACIPFLDGEEAARVTRMIRGGELDFHEAAERNFLTTARSGTRAPETFAVVRRGHDSSDSLKSVFAAEPGDVVGPLPSAESHLAVRVLAFVRARLDDATRRTIENVLFEDWLARLRQDAAIEWYWGRAG